MASQKTDVIEWIFNQRFDPATRTVSDPVVTMDHIVEGIVQTKSNLSQKNAANFWKDLTRTGKKGLDANWPKPVANLGFGGTDGIGRGGQFVFVPVPVGHSAPDYDFAAYDPSLPSTQLQSLSMPLAMRSLGRPSENWQSQVAARLDVVASYFAFHSPRNVRPRSVEEVNFLQTGVKVGGTGEIDATFSLIAHDGQWLVSAEVKGRSEQFYLPQIKRAAIKLGEMARSGKSPALAGIAGVIPLGIKVVAKSTLWVVEFEPVVDAKLPLTKAAEGVFRLVPHVPGIQ
ncbi:MAG: hypothetical protein LBE05_01390 [Microbacterium sp.]|nr:hypothetical protein [Microbacterium sp.]